MPSELRPDERASIELRALYQAYGYRPYRVGRFEEYDLYRQNKHFLESERILTFSDTDGRLLAMRPDVTLSIVKNMRAQDVSLKVCYAERVYRVPRGEKGFREIMQTGVECIGTVDAYATGEVVMLAARSLAAIGKDYVLDLSDMGIVTGVLEGEVLDSTERRELLRLIREKNAHGLKEACARLSVSHHATQLLVTLVHLGGPLAEALPNLEALDLPGTCDEAIEHLKAVSAMAKAYGLEHICLDFSVVNDMGYYNGIILNGFIDGVPSLVLSGGRYDPLLRRMGRRGEGIGFAVYLDQVERYLQREEGPDVDVLITCDEQTDPVSLARLADELVHDGERVCVQRYGETGVTFRRQVHMEGGGCNP